MWKIGCEMACGSFVALFEAHTKVCSGVMTGTGATATGVVAMAEEKRMREKKRRAEATIPPEKTWVGVEPVT